MAEDQLRVTLVSTAGVGVPGSMRAYADTLIDALSHAAPQIEVDVLELDPLPARSRWSERLRTLRLPRRARRAGTRTPTVWHVLDGSRARVASALSGAPVVITVHDIIPWLQARGRFAGVASPGIAARWLWWRNGSQMRRAAVLVCDSEATAADVQREFEVAPEACRVVQLPLRPTLAAFADRASQSDAAREPVIMHVGNNSFYKDRARVLRIFALVAPTLSTRLVMLGPQPTRALHDLAGRLGIDQRIEWIVDPTDDVLSVHYARSSVFLFPSRYEGYGWPVLEAMAFGLPVVASKCPSIVEIAGSTGVFLDVGEGDDRFAAAAATFIRDPAAARHASAAGRIRASQLNVVRFASEMREVYASVARAERAVAAERT